MRVLFRCSVLALLVLSVACQSTRQTTKNASVDDNGVMDITIATMRKDAVRLKGEITALNEPLKNRNSYSFSIQEVVKYGATFSSVDPKVGTLVTLLTPKDVSFKQGQVIVVDVLTPKFTTGSEPMTFELGQP